jgi:hypothetical protein
MDRTKTQGSGLIEDIFKSSINFYGALKFSDNHSKRLTYKFIFSWIPDSADIVPVQLSLRPPVVAGVPPDEVVRRTVQLPQYF